MVEPFWDKPGFSLVDDVDDLLKYQYSENTVTAMKN